MTAWQWIEKNSGWLSWQFLTLGIVVHPATHQYGWYLIAFNLGMSAAIWIYRLNPNEH